MLSIKPIGSSTGEVTYYATLGVEDYYAQGGEPPGTWWGDGAQALGLSGIVQGQTLRSLMQGRDASGSRSLVQNAGSQSRRSAFDLTWTVPKSVSVAWSQGDLAFRQSIELAGERAVHKALGAFQQLCGQSRRGKHGVDTEAAKLIGAVFKHDTARSVANELPDPNLHWHAVILNLAVRPDGSTGALDARGLFRPHMKMALGALFRAELSKELAALDLATYRPQKNGREQSWFELEGIPEELINVFSKRRAAIQSWLQARGLSGAKAAEMATNVTKSRKGKWNRQELLEHWQSIGRHYVFDLRQMYSTRGLVCPSALTDRNVESVAATITSQHSHSSKVELLRRVAESVQGKGIGIDEIFQAVEHALRTSQELISFQHAGELRVTTQSVLETERRLVSMIEQSRLERIPVPTRLVASTLAQYPTLKTDQLQAVRHVTEASGRIACINGMPPSVRT